MAAERTLVAGIGNIFLGDDGLGCEVVRRLSQADLHEWYGRYLYFAPDELEPLA